MTKRIPISKLIFFTLAANLFGFILIFGAAELCLRIREPRIVDALPRAKGEVAWRTMSIYYDAQGGRRLIPDTHVIIKNHYDNGRDIRLDVNSLGFRHKEIPPEKEPNEIRILVLGDSIAFCDYLQADEIWHQRAQRILAAQYPQKTIEVINAGVNGIGLREEMDILTKSGLKTHPDAVVVAFYLNDSRPPWGFYNELGAKGFLRRHSLLADSLYRRVKLWGWAKEQGEDRFAWIGAVKKLDWAHSREDFLKLADLAKYDWGAAWQPDSWGIVREQFAQLKTLSERHGFRVALLAFPVSYQVEADFLEDAPQRTLRQLSTQLGFHYLDFLPQLRPHRKESLQFDQCHFRLEANELVGRIFADFLRDDALKGLLK